MGTEEGNCGVCMCVCASGEQETDIHGEYTHVHNRTQTYTPHCSSHLSTSARPHGAPWRHERPENLIFPNTHQDSPSSSRDSAGDN